MTKLNGFLAATDLDDLLRARNEIAALTSEESTRIVSVLRAWNDHQAVANLLFHPDLIPAEIRFEALDRALHSEDVPYLTLAATVGLQGMSMDDVPSDKRAAWGQMLLAFIQSKSTVLSSRASVTLCAWSRGVVTSDIPPMLASLYPVLDEGVCRNIVAAVLENCGDCLPQEFDQRLSNWRVSEPTRAALRRAHANYTELKGRDTLRAMIMKAPVHAYIPNLSEVMIDNAQSATVRTGSPPARKPWWRFW